MVALLVGASALGAQGSPYVPLDDIAYRYIDALMSRGEFRQLSALERPYTVRAVQSAIDRARIAEPSGRLSDYLDAVDAAVDKYSPRPRHGKAGTRTTRTIFE
ncbi:MAG TPA: hypothetical protein VF111_12860, partial [Thermoanaerobaculia bacterium]